MLGLKEVAECYGLERTFLVTRYIAQTLSVSLYVYFMDQQLVGEEGTRGGEKYEQKMQRLQRPKIQKISKNFFRE